MPEEHDEGPLEHCLLVVPMIVTMVIMAECFIFKMYELKQKVQLTFSNLVKQMKRTSAPWLSFIV